jgi:hypothetical protein
VRKEQLLVNIEYQIREDDFVSAAKLAIHKRSKWAAFWIYALRVWGAVLLVFSLTALVLRRDTSSLGVPLMLGTLLSSLSLLWSFQFRRQYRNNLSLHNRRTLEANDDAVSFTTDDSEGRVGWANYAKFVESDACFLLFQHGNQIFVPITKRELTPIQITELRSLFEAHLPDK